MIRRKNEITMRKVTNVQDGKGEIVFHDWLLPKEAVGHGRVFSKVVISQGSSIGFHQHVGEFEAYYVLEGEAIVNDNGEEIILHPGDMHLCKDGDGHGVENKGDQDLVLIALILNQLA